jgi:hypothetical protein
MNIELTDKEVRILNHLMTKQRCRPNTPLEERELIVKLETLTNEEIKRL